MMAAVKPVSQQFVTKLFAKMDDDYHEIITKVIAKVSGNKATKAASK